jgi:hypothetical protein
MAKTPKKHRLRIERPNARRPRHPRKDYRRLIEAAWAQGWWVERRRKYIYCKPPDETRDIVKVPMTPSDQRTLRNVERNLRASGLGL